MTEKTVILANGKFPEHPIPLSYLKSASMVVCCDGSAHNLLRFGLEPGAIIGDIDSLDKEISEKFSNRLFRDADQETNDLTKAVMWCIARGIKEIIILGATGLREDHTIGNISLLAEYAKHIKVRMITDTGEFLPLLTSSEIATFPGQNISVFSIDPETEISSSGLKYPLKRIKLKNWWMATLNESDDSYFTLEFEGCPLIIYLRFPDK
jgi:thiamine pyrophosphokinase